MDIELFDGERLDEVNEDITLIQKRTGLLSEQTRTCLQLL